MAQLRLQRKRIKSQPALQIIFKSSQSYTIESKWKSADIFLVGGGASGSAQNASSNPDRYGAGGGGGGKTATYSLLALTSRNISVTIGSGGPTNNRTNNIAKAGGNTTISIDGTNYTANGGSAGSATLAGSNGGSGGGGGGSGVSVSGIITAGAGGSDGGNGKPSRWGDADRYTGGQGQSVTTRAFGLPTEALYAGGGGGIVGTMTYGMYSGAGGSGGGGRGAYGGQGGSAGSVNTGGGGGGSATCSSSNAGGSGVAIIRLYKNNNRPTDIDWTENTIIID